MKGSALLLAALSPSLLVQGAQRPLEQARAAIGHAALQTLRHGIVVEGKCREGGTDGTFRWTLLRDGRFRLATQSVLGYARGFDGTRGWKVDSSGMPGPLELTDLAVSQLWASVLSGRWLDGAGAAGNVVTLAKDASLTLDRATGAPQRLAFPTGVAVDFEDWSDFASLRFPERLVRIEPAGARDTFTVTAVRAAAESDVASCAAVAERPADTRFEGELPAKLELKRVRSGHLLVHPRVDGKDIGWFILDTGAGRSCVDKTGAAECELVRIGTVTARGVGGSVPAHWLRAESLRVGPATIAKPVFVELDLAFLTKIFGVRVGGILGYDFLSRCLVEIDMKAKELTIDRPGAWDDREAPWLPARFAGNQPAVRCTLEGERAGLFKLDTGAGGNLTLHSGFVDEHALLEGRATTSARHGGVGGMVEARAGRLQWFELAGHRFEDTAVVFARGKRGAFGNAKTAGNIGNGYLQRFRLLVDYPNRRIGFVPRRP